MNAKQIIFLSWNVRGLGDLNKCDVVRNVIKNSRCDVCCMQEVKWNNFDLSYISRVLPSFLDKNCAMVFADNTKGGILIAWKKSFIMVNSWASRHSISVLLVQESTGWEFLVTNVYGPSDDALKLDFIRELRGVQALVRSPWALLGDFNMVRWLVDRSADMRRFEFMCAFNDMIRDFDLMDVEMSNRSFTWSSKRPRPVFSRLDRVLLSIYPMDPDFSVNQIKCLRNDCFGSRTASAKLL